MPQLKAALTKAEERVLRKAAKSPVMRAGAFSGGDQAAARKHNFDRPLLIDRCIASGLLAPTDWFNKYAITPKGVTRLSNVDQIRAACAAKRFAV